MAFTFMSAIIRWGERHAEVPATRHTMGGGDHVVRYEISLISRVGLGHSKANKNLTGKWRFFFSGNIITSATCVIDLTKSNVGVN